MAGIESIKDFAEAIAATVEGSSPGNTPALMEVFLDEGAIELRVAQGGPCRLAVTAPSDVRVERSSACTIREAPHSAP